MLKIVLVLSVILSCTAVVDGNVIPLDCPTLIQIGNSGCKYARMGVVRP